jgi:hypothetical protein
MLEGDIERIGDQYRIHRSTGDTWLPAAKVRQLCADLEDALAYQHRQANLNDPDERLRLARWCLLHELRAQALAEVTAALELRPNHAESLRLKRGLERSLASEPAPPPRPKEEPAEAGAIANLPYNPDALSLFVTRVQPILMNTCATCHAAGKGGSFKLTRCHDQGLPANRRATQQNLMATLAQLNMERPAQSPLLNYALTMHGNAEQPPLKGRQTAAFRLLEDWAQLAALHSARAATPAPTSAPTPVFVSPPGSPLGKSDAFAEGMAGNNLAVEVPGPAPLEASGFGASQPQPKDPVATPAPPPSPPASSSSPPQKPVANPPATPSPPATGQPVDPFDPLIFNQQLRPEQ